MSYTGTVDPCAELKTRIPELPRVMREQRGQGEQSRDGWVKGAELLEDWLHRGANNNPENATPNIDTIQMRWVLGFGRAWAVYQSAKVSKVWVNEAAQRKIIEKLIHRKNRLPKKVGEKLEIGNVGEDFYRQPYFQHFHAEWQIQYKEVIQSPITGQLDDLYAALGDFSFYYLVKGSVERLPDQNNKSRYKVTINKVGVYVQDSYDFNDNRRFTKIVSEPLGVWNCKTDYAGKEPWKGYAVQNKDFREWRERYGRGYGGDFMVFSDIMVFNTNDSFEF